MKKLKAVMINGAIMVAMIFGLLFAENRINFAKETSCVQEAYKAESTDKSYFVSPREASWGTWSVDSQGCLEINLISLKQERSILYR